MNWKPPVFAIFFALLAGCASAPTVQYNPLKVSNYLPKTATEIDTYITNKPTTQYLELGVLTLKSWSPSPDEMFAIQAFKVEAAKVGGDGIIVLDSRTGSAGNSHTKTVYAFTDFRAMVIKYVP